MTKLTLRTCSAFAAAGVLGIAFMTAQPAASAETAPSYIVLAQASTPSATPAPTSQPSAAAPSSMSSSSTTAKKPVKSAANRTDRVEAHIATLKTQLKITAAEEPQWNNVASVMRDNAKTVGALVQDRAQNARKMNAIEDLKSYEGIAQAHADGMKKLVTAFQSLYDTMSPEQKKTADSVFDNPRRTAGKTAAKKAG